MINRICGSLFSCLFKTNAELHEKQTVSLEIIDNTLTELPTDDTYVLNELPTNDEEEDNEPFGYSSKKIVFKLKQKNKAEREMKYIFVSTFIFYIFFLGLDREKPNDSHRKRN